MILIAQLKEIWIDGELGPVETANWFPKLARKDYHIGLNNTGSGVDDPDQQFFENYGCGSERNYTGYCNSELEALFVEQSTMANREKRRRLVWEIDKKLQEDGARPKLHWRARTDSSGTKFKLQRSWERRVSRDPTITSTCVRKLSGRDRQHLSKGGIARSDQSA